MVMPTTEGWHYILNGFYKLGEEYVWLSIPFSYSYLTVFLYG